MHLTQERGHRWGLCQMQDEGRQNNLHAAQQCKLKCRLTGEWLQCPERHRAGFLQKANLQIGWEGEGVGFARVQKKSQKQALQPDLRQISGGNKSLRAFRSIIGTESHQMGAGKGASPQSTWEKEPEPSSPSPGTFPRTQPGSQTSPFPGYVFFQRVLFSGGRVASSDG